MHYPAANRVHTDDRYPDQNIRFPFVKPTTIQSTAALSSSIPHHLVYKPKVTNRQSSTVLVPRHHHPHQASHYVGPSLVHKLDQDVPSSLSSSEATDLPSSLLPGLFPKATQYILSAAKADDCSGSFRRNQLLRPVQRNRQTQPEKLPIKLFFFSWLNLFILFLIINPHFHLSCLPVIPRIIWDEGHLLFSRLSFNQFNTAQQFRSIYYFESGPGF